MSSFLTGRVGGSKLKRYIAREMFRHLSRPDPVPAGADLRRARVAAHLSLKSVADALGTWSNRISELERGLLYDNALALRYMAMLASINSTAAGIDNAA